MTTHEDDGLWHTATRIFGVPLLIIYAVAGLCWLLGVGTLWAIETAFGK